jgi:hypothetical protein
MHFGRLLVFSIVLLVGDARAAANAVTTTDDKPARVQVAAQDVSIPFRAQLPGELDRPIGDAITLGTLTMPTRINAKGHLEIDGRNEGKFRTILRQEIISLTLKGEGAKKSQAIKLSVRKKDDGTWVYRNMTQLQLTIDTEQFIVIDANGNGAYNEPGIDGLAWKGETVLFPLPAAGERWCSATQNITGLQFGPWGEQPSASTRPLTTTVMAALPVLKGVNEERVKLGLTPRPEDARLSADLQKHCVYMKLNKKVQHEEEKGKSGFSQEGHEAGLRSILSSGKEPQKVAEGMVNTYFHRVDVVRPNTNAFGVGYEDIYGGIDGRTSLDPATAQHFPVLCPMPGQQGIGLVCESEFPDPTPGDKSAGFPISVYFNTRNLKLSAHSLKAVGPAPVENKASSPAPKPSPASGPPIDCYVNDPQTGASPQITAFSQCVCIIPKDPLKVSTEYEVSLTVDVDGTPWMKTWRFSTGAEPAPPKAQRVKK